MLFFGCHEQNKNKVSTAELMKSREIKKVSEAEILKKGGELGSQILSSLQKVVELKVNADTAICDMTMWTGLDSLAAKYQSKINRVNTLTVDKSNLEFQLLEAYQYNLENQLTPSASIQKLDEKTVVYAYPIDRESNIYNYCMDSISRQKAEMWRIKIPIKEIINRL